MPGAEQTDRLAALPSFDGPEDLSERTDTELLKLSDGNAGSYRVCQADQVGWGQFDL